MGTRPRAHGDGGAKSAPKRGSAATLTPGTQHAEKCVRGLYLANGRGGFGQRRREARADPHTVQPRGEFVGPSLQCTLPVAAGVFQQLQPDAGAVVLVPAAHHTPVPPRGRAGVAVPVEHLTRDVGRGTNPARTSPSWWRPARVAAHPTAASAGSARGRPAARNPGLPCRSTCTAPMSVSAFRTAVNVVPNHHLMSARWPARKCAASDGSARPGSSTGSSRAPSHSAATTQRGRDVVQLPSLGPRTISPRAESTVSTRGAIGMAPPQRFPGAGS